MHWDVSTLPATVAAGGRGASSEPSGMMTSIGRRQPALSGISSSTSVRNTYNTAACTTAGGALKLLASSALVPVKSTQALRRARSTVTRTAITAPLSMA
jgi:hypothetical protein